MMNSNDDSQKVAVVTGAGGGVGRAACQALARKGYAIVLVGRTAEKLDATAAQITGEHLVLPTDLCDPVATRQVIQRTVERFGHIDALVNVAGHAVRMPIEQTTPEVWRQVVDANLSYIVNLTAAAWPILRNRGGGAIVNVSSMSSIDPFDGLSLYAAAKVGLNMFTRCTAREGAAIGVRAVALVLGAVETAMLRSMFDESMVPRAMAYDPAEVAKVICDCITGDRSFEPGEAIQLVK